MQKKTIKAVLKKKMQDWLASIPEDQEEVRNAIKKDVIITGGSIVSMLMKEKPKDFDVYFTNKESLKIVAKYYVDKFNADNNQGCHKARLIDGFEQKKAETKEEDEPEVPEDRLRIWIQSQGVASEEGDGFLNEPFEDVYDQYEKADEIDGDELEEPGKDEPKEKYRPIFLSSNAITLSDKIQIIVRFYGNADQIHENYDFVHCTNYWESKTGDLTLRQPALESILEKRLVYQGSKYPICSIIRTRKFIKRGWEINAGQYLKMCFQVSQLDLTNISVMEDQLIGVDSAYFSMLIDKLKHQAEERKAKGEDFELTGDYVCSVIDKIF